MRSLERVNSGGSQAAISQQHLVHLSASRRLEQQQRLISHPRAKSPAVPFNASLLPRKRIGEL